MAKRKENIVYAEPITIEELARKINTLEDKVNELRTILETTKENIRNGSGDTNVSQLDKLVEDLRARGIVP